MFTLETRMGIPMFFGLWTSYEWIVVATDFEHWVDAVSYAYNVAGFDHCDQFIVTKGGIDIRKLNLGD
jgi:hypothetical protein